MPGTTTFGVLLTILYMHVSQVLLPQHPGLGRLLMSRHVAIQVLERQADFLNSIEDAGVWHSRDLLAYMFVTGQRLGTVCS
jgi:hypothetical protein